MDIILIRHGETYDNLNKIFGRKTTSLTDKGREEIKNARELIKDIEYERVFYSPLKRTKETLDILGLEGKEDKRLEEYDFGIFTGKTFSEIEKEYPETTRKWVENPLEYKIPKGDSLKDLYEDLKVFLDKLVEEDKDTILVTHAGIIQLALCWVFDDIEHYYRFKVDCGSTNIIRVDNNYKYIYKLNWK